MFGGRDRDEERRLIQAGYRYAVSLTHNPHDAEDLIQQSCLNVLRQRGAIANKRYLFATVRNLFVDQLRRRQGVSLDDLDSAVADPAPNHEEVSDRRQQIEQLLSRLRPQEREVLYLNCVEGFTAEEIGQLTNRPRGTVLSLLSRAKQRLAATQSDQMVDSRHE